MRRRTALGRAARHRDQVSGPWPRDGVAYSSPGSQLAGRCAVGPGPAVHAFGHKPAITRTPSVTGWLAGKDWTAIPTTRPVVALTFDAGANADAVPSILATLRREGVPATFFLTGNFVRDFPAAARSMAAAGFRIGDHTITHPYLTRLSDAAVRQEILGAAQQIMSVTGKNPARLFRFPYGDADIRTIALANQAGYVPARWTVDTLGWQGTAGHTSWDLVLVRPLGPRFELIPEARPVLDVGSAGPASAGSRRLCRTRRHWEATGDERSKRTWREGRNRGEPFVALCGGPAGSDRTWARRWRPHAHAVASNPSAASRAG